MLVFQRDITSQRIPPKLWAHLKSTRPGGYKALERLGLSSVYVIQQPEDRDPSKPARSNARFMMLLGSFELTAEERTCFDRCIDLDAVLVIDGRFCDYQA